MKNKFIKKIAPGVLAVTMFTSGISYAAPKYIVETEGLKKATEDVEAQETIYIIVGNKAYDLVEIGMNEKYRENLLEEMKKADNIYVSVNSTSNDLDRTVNYMDMLSLKEGTFKERMESVENIADDIKEDVHLVKENLEVGEKIDRIFGASEGSTEGEAGGNEGETEGETGNETEKEAIELTIDPENLVANGKTMMKVHVKLNTPNVEKMGGMLEIESKLGLKASKTEQALDKGEATFNIQLPSSVKDLEDLITVRVKSHDVVDGVAENELVGKSISKKVTYKGMSAEGDSSQKVVREYEVSSVRSMDVADRVAVYVGMKNEVDIEEVKEAIIEQVKLYNNEDGNNPIDLLKIIEHSPVDGGYAFTALIDLGLGDEEVENVNVLHDNQYNYYSVKESKAELKEDQNNISLKKKGFDSKNRFMLIDSKRPEVRMVKATKNDNKYLPNHSLLVEFNEAVNRQTAEDPANWTLNGKNLKEHDGVKKITLLDVREAYSNPDAADILDWTAIEEGKERNSVLIELKPSFARRELRNGQDNLLQVKSVSDWAGLTDLSDNNKISTQEFKFMYDVKEDKLELEIKSQSPEQFVLKLKGDGLFKDEDAEEPFDLAEDTKDTEDTESMLTAKLGKTVVEDFEIRKVKGKTDEYILELTKDWTRILDGKEAYHGKEFKVELNGGSLYDVYGSKVEKLEKSVTLEEDTESPEISDHEILKDEEGRVIDGSVLITMDEPVQLFKEGANGKIDIYTNPQKLTPKSDQDQVSEPSFKYVEIDSIENSEDENSKDENSKDENSKGKEVVGEIVYGSVDEYDEQFKVQPTETLSPGNWKLVVRGISDDVGNTMKTTSEIKFTIDEIKPEEPEKPVEKQLLDPHLLWAYALDNEESGLDKDYVVLLFSRQMDIDVLKSSTYHINGKRIDQDAKITDELIDAYGSKVKGWKAHKVVIELPADFIVSNKDTNALTLPENLKAINDNVEETKDVLLGGNQYELDYTMDTDGKNVLDFKPGINLPKDDVGKAKKEVIKETKKVEIEKIKLTDEEKEGKTEESIKAAEAKLEEAKNAAKNEVDEAKTIEDLKAVKVDKIKEDALRELKDKPELKEIKLGEVTKGEDDVFQLTKDQEINEIKLEFENLENGEYTFEVTSDKDKVNPERLPEVKLEVKDGKATLTLEEPSLEAGGVGEFTYNVTIKSGEGEEVKEVLTFEVKTNVSEKEA